MMSLAGLPWSHFNSFPDSPHFPIPYPSASLAFLSHGVSQLSSSLDMAALSPEELERFQKLSNEFEPDVPVCPSTCASLSLTL